MLYNEERTNNKERDKTMEDQRSVYLEILKRVARKVKKNMTRSRVVRVNRKGESILNEDHNLYTRILNDSALYAGNIICSHRYRSTPICTYEIWNYYHDPEFVGFVKSLFDVDEFCYGSYDLIDSALTNACRALEQNREFAVRKLN